MIFGIGTDIVEVSRIEDSLTRFGNSFAERILNEAEWQSYMQSNTPARFLAKRFAAKEAFAKALGTGVRAPATLPAIAVMHDELGKPAFAYSDELAALLREKRLSAHLSISDERDYAVAFVILEQT